MGSIIESGLDGLVMRVCALQDIHPKNRKLTPEQQNVIANKLGRQYIAGDDTASVRGFARGLLKEHTAIKHSKGGR